MPTAPVLSVRRLTTWFDTPGGMVQAVDGVDFTVMPGDILAIVGESGSGKSVTALSLLKLVSTPPGRYVAGEVRLGDGPNLLALDETALEDIRGSRLAMLFQHPRDSLDPSFSVHAQLRELLHRHRPELDRRAMERLQGELLAQVGFDDPARVAASYPHQLSGGMCQRVALALAMACHPRLLVADEPTTALDVSVQTRILLLLRQRNYADGLPIVLITHDFTVVRAVANRVLVMYAGQVQEQGEARELLNRPRHPYTVALLRAIPAGDRRRGELQQIPGQPPVLVNPPPGCRFAPRCQRAWRRCEEELPALHPLANGHQVRCHLFDPLEKTP